VNTVSHLINSSPSDDSCLIPPQAPPSSASLTGSTKKPEEPYWKVSMDMLPPAQRGRPKKSQNAPSQHTTNDEPSPTQESSLDSLFKPPPELPQIELTENLEGFPKILAQRAIYNVDRMTYLAGVIESIVTATMEPNEIARLTGLAMRLRAQAITQSSKIAGDFKEVLKRKKESVDAA